MTSAGPLPWIFTELHLIITTHSVVEALSDSSWGKGLLVASLFYPKGTLLWAVLNRLFFFPELEK